MIHAGEEEPAPLRILEAREQVLRKRRRTVHQLTIERRFVEIEQGIQKIRVIIQVGVELRAAVPPGAEKPPLTVQMAEDERGAALAAVR